ncbi:hypothetical protein V496_02365 [Pseudogymnoascus sp. VKM F-4515 (FW-2607)]|nr:hypothetical protein V496_02365 [Pseudogymnoascus sp. VKM F-4515 (FW-2607)]KFY97387.1 hypothetical protein V498_02095 [Pseudogymnoascus sp. VKM F-4517 (FW-2822)]
MHNPSAATAHNSSAQLAPPPYHPPSLQTHNKGTQTTSPSQAQTPSPSQATQGNYGTVHAYPLRINVVCDRRGDDGDGGAGGDGDVGGVAAGVDV